MNQCSIFDNSAGSNGGGICNLNFFSNVQIEPNLQLTNSLVMDNAAGANGGGIWNGFSDVLLTNSTVVGNAAGGNGGGIADFFSSSSVVENCIFWENDLHQHRMAYLTVVCSWLEIPFLKHSCRAVPFRISVRCIHGRRGK